jgi:hypothetical protein
MPFARETDFQESGDFRASVINEELDRMAMLLQQAEMIVEDGLHKQPYDADASLILPTATNRANKILGFDVAGLPVTLAEPYDSAAAAEGSATAASASAAAALVSENTAASSATVALKAVTPTETFSGTGAQTIFALGNTVLSSKSIQIFIGGIKQETSTYTASGTTLTFTTPPPTGTDNIEVVFIGVIGYIGTPGAIPDDALSGDMISGGTMDGVSFDGLNGGPLAGFRNYLMNGSFLVWQRGVSFTANAEYSADRFQHTFAGGSSGTVSRQAFTPGQTDVPGEPEYYFRFDKTTHVAGYSTIFKQNIEDVRTFAGQTATISFWAKVSTGTKNVKRRQHCTHRRRQARRGQSVPEQWL